MSGWAWFIFKPAKNGCPWLSSGWVTGLALLSSLLNMVVLGSLGCEWLGLLCFKACWKWPSLILQNVSDWACFVLNPAENGHPWSSGCEWLSLLCFWGCWKWLFLVQRVSDWACFVFKPAENGCPWFFRVWVTRLALFSSLLKMIALGSSECEWLGLLCFQAC